MYSWTRRNFQNLEKKQNERKKMSNGNRNSSLWNQKKRKWMLCGWYCELIFNVDLLLCTVLGYSYPERHWTPKSFSCIRQILEVLENRVTDVRSILDFHVSSGHVFYCSLSCSRYFWVQFATFFRFLLKCFRELSTLALRKEPLILSNSD